MERRAPSLGQMLLSASAWITILFLALPLVIIVSTSFTASAFLQFPPAGFSLKWYAQFLGDRSYLDSLALSGWLAVSATATAVVLGVPVALVLTRAQFKGSRALAALFLSPLILPPIVIGAALLQFGTSTGIARTFWVLYVGHVVLVIPYIVRTTLASLAGFNNSLEEAAQDLGASAVSTFFLITLPLIKPGIIAGSLFAIIISWINVELSMFNTTASLMPIPVKLFNYIQYNVDPMIAAVSATTIYVAIIVVVALDRVIGIDRAATN
ncbi:putative spermidine/putrescine transport system permease protein [Rhodoligotrophos appendicifer]|uniref:ABC transporter permease n=1 Tax=Rhodoligotrophos appendicifer TaxID=987056 RepID=UPI00118052CF|nr:ABC transporter permease [Rhodoligotrophos appendicifer]